MALITDISTIRDHVSVDSDLTLNVLKPHLNYAERYVKKVLGLAQYLALNTAIAADSTTQEQEALLEVIYPSLSRLTVVIWMEGGSLSLGNSGVSRTETSTNKTPYKYQEDAVKRRLTMEGFEMLDDVVAFLEENEADYPAWAGDANAYVRFKQFFINTCEQFEEHYPILGSRITFRAFYSMIKYVENNVIRPVIGNALYAEIKEQVKTVNVSADNEYLLDNWIRPAVAFGVINEALKILPVQVSDGGVKVVELMQTFPSDVIEKNAPEDARSMKMVDADTKCKKALVDLKTELKEHASAGKYASYYNEIGVTESTDRNTDTTKKIYRA